VVTTCGSGSHPYYHLLTPVDNLWACLQVTGFVYDQVESSTTCGSQNIAYHLRIPYDGLWSCGPGTYNGYTYDEVILGDYCAVGVGVQSPSYHIRLPVNSLWSCLQVAGYVYDNTMNTAACSTAGSAPMYHIRTPADGLWSCQQVNGYVYDEIEGVATCVIGETAATKYHLKLPVNGLWSCGPGTYNGYTYDAMTTDSNECYVGYGSAPQYHLIKPEPGVWVCLVPSGWTYSETRAVNNCSSPVPSASTEYLLLSN
jgi:hypothetical protein